MKKKNEISPSIEEMKGWFYVHSDVAAFTSYVIADDPFGKNKDFNEACFNDAYNTLENALTIIANSKVKSILSEVNDEIRFDEIKNLINRYKNELEKKAGFKTFRPELTCIKITDSYLDYKWLEHYNYEDYIKIKELKNINLENWLNSKRAPFLTNWVLHLLIIELKERKEKVQYKTPPILERLRKYKQSLNKSNPSGKIITAEDINRLCEKLDNHLKEWEISHETEFNETLESVKGYLNSHGLILPLDWKEVYVKWYAKKIPYKKHLKLNGNYPTGNRSIIINWAIAYTNKMNAKLKPLEKPKPSKFERNNLKELFKDNQKIERWNEIVQRLQTEDSEGMRYIDENGTWAIKKQGNKLLLAGLIYFISITYLKIDLNKNEIADIAINNFNQTISRVTAQNGKNNFDKYGFDIFFSIDY